MRRLARMRRDNVISEAAARMGISVSGEGNAVEVDPLNDAACLSRVRVRIIGNGNRVTIGKGLDVRGSLEIDIVGDDNEVRLGENLTVIDLLLLQVLKNCRGGKVRIGDFCSFWRTEIRNYDSGSVTEVGDDCMFSFRTELRNSDEHALFADGQLRRGRILSVGNHCWIGYEAAVFKNALVGDGTVVGARALVTGRFGERRTVLAGIPARVVRRGVLWDRRSPNEFPDDEIEISDATGVLAQKLASCKYVHLMFNDKFIAPFVRFLNRHFDPSEHVVLCKRWFDEHPFPEASNVIEMKSYAGVDLSRPNIRKVVCHSLFDAEVVDILYAQRDVLSQKAYWSIWGGDLYRAPRDAKNDFVRRNFRGCIFSPDREFALARYGMRDEFHDIILYAPIERDLLDVAKRETVPSGKVRVQVNNSCDESTLEMLRALARFRGRIIVTTVLSYGDLKWRTAVRDLGKELFGADFEVQDSFLPRPEYARYLASNDILILNQARQQGLGNTGAMLYLGKKVFIRSEISTYRYLRGRGMAVFDSHAIAGMDFPDFIGYADSERANTQRTANEVFFDDRSRAAGLQRLLEDS